MSDLLEPREWTSLDSRAVLDIEQDEDGANPNINEGSAVLAELIIEPQGASIEPIASISGTGCVPQIVVEATLEFNVPSHSVSLTLTGELEISSPSERGVRFHASESSYGGSLPYSGPTPLTDPSVVVRFGFDDPTLAVPLDGSMRGVYMVESEHGADVGTDLQYLFFAW